MLVLISNTFNVQYSLDLVGYAVTKRVCLHFVVQCRYQLTNVHVILTYDRQYGGQDGLFVYILGARICYNYTFLLWLYKSCFMNMRMLIHYLLVTSQRLFLS